MRAIMGYDNMNWGVEVVLSWGVTPWSVSWVGAIMGYDTIMSIAGGSHILEELNAPIFFLSWMGRQKGPLTSWYTPADNKIFFFTVVKITNFVC
jgi:hypothetical protein